MKIYKLQISFRLTQTGQTLKEKRKIRIWSTHEIRKTWEQEIKRQLSIQYGKGGYKELKIFCIGINQLVRCQRKIKVINLYRHGKDTSSGG